ncbi:hypothetical protein [Priestia aryabhattai]
MDSKDKKSFNDVEDHLNNIEGNSTNINTKGLPKALRVFGYIFVGFFILLILITIFSSIFR